jgi:hypothetical protein
MRLLVSAIALSASLALVAGSVWAADNAKGPGSGNVGGNVGVQAGGGGAKVNANVGGGDRGRGADINVDAGRGGANIEANVDRGNRTDRRESVVDRNRSNTRDRGKIGDNNWDRWGVGRLDDSRFRNNAGNDWRYRRWGNEWWYWMPAGYWMYWRNGDWTRYDADSYSYGDQGNYASFSGPYYEDSNGFYYLQNDRRIYDPQIRRVGNEVGGRIEVAPR